MQLAVWIITVAFAAKRGLFDCGLGRSWIIFTTTEPSSQGLQQHCCCYVVRHRLGSSSGISRSSPSTSTSSCFSWLRRDR